MPIDLGVLRKLDKPAMTGQLVKSTGNTNFTWEAYEGDIQIDRLNNLMQVEGLTKLAQGIFKIVLTPIGSNQEDPNYGSLLNDQIGSKMDTEKFAHLQTSIVDALTHYNSINQDNPSSDEVIETIDEVRLVQSLDDPRQIKVQISVTTESGKSVSVQVPQVQ
jgi:phage baseplate assembly protein W